MGKGIYGYPGMKTASRIGRPTRNINSNIASVRQQFDFKDGYFGVKYKGDKVPEHRRIECNDPIASARDLFQKLGKGGVQEVLRDDYGNAYGWKRMMIGRDVLTLRVGKSSDGSPVVDINIRCSTSSVKRQKIHFYKKEV